MTDGGYFYDTRNLCTRPNGILTLKFKTSSKKDIALMKFNPFPSFSIFKLLIQLKSGKSFSYVQYFTLIAHSITLFIHTEIEIFPFFTHTFFLLYKSNRTRESIHICKDHNQFNAILMFYRTSQIKLNSHFSFTSFFSMNFLYNFFWVRTKMEKE